MSLLLIPFSLLFGLIVKLRNFLFDIDWLKSKAVSVPVVSVGNLSVGGTGKTPFVMQMLSYLENKGLKVGIVSRGYGGNYHAVAEVDVSQDWKIFGDEPYMIKTRFPNVPIFLGAKRVEAAKALLNKHPVDLILADDAFQHRYLKRNLDIVLLDATQSLGEYHLLPWGRLRESFGALKRAQWVVITKSNLLEENQKAKVLDFLKQVVKDPSRMLTADLKPKGLFDSAGKQVVLLENSRLFMLSGIGRPGSFQLSVEKFLNKKTERHWSFQDHYEYTEGELKQILSQLKTGEKLVTTEKDFMRIRSFSEVREHILIFRVDMTLEGATDEFWTQVTRLAL